MPDTRMLPRIVVIEDDAVVAETLTLYLEHAGFSVVTASDGREGLALARRPGIALVILDLMIPGMSGQQICRALRESSRVPILMLTARTSEDDRVAGLEMGADDYVPKPFSPREVVARVQALLRRVGEPDANLSDEAGQPDQTGTSGLLSEAGQSRRSRSSSPSARSGQLGQSRRSESDVLRAGSIEIDRWSRQVRNDGRLVTLTPTELRLLEALVRHPGRTFTRDELVARAFGPDYEGLDRTIDTHVTNLRRKLAPTPSASPAPSTSPGPSASPASPASSTSSAISHIVTVHGIGYKLATSEEER